MLKLHVSSQIHFAQDILRLEDACQPGLNYVVHVRPVLFCDICKVIIAVTSGAKAQVVKKLQWLPDNRLDSAEA